MTARFLVIAAVMVVVALACVLVPMLRAARREGRPRTPFVLALSLALVTPPLVLALYLAVGTPLALQAPPTPNRTDLAQATAQLRASLAQKPDDARGWALLAQAYIALGQPRQAMTALDRLLALQPDDPDAMTAWVEAAADAHPNHFIDDASRARLKHALQVDPTHQRAMWLLGISDFQRNQFDAAAKQWRTLLPLLEPGSSVANAVRQEIAAAEARAGSASTVAGAAPATSPEAASDAVALRVTVALAPQFAAKVTAADTLFVFARAVDGPPMPLAVARLPASKWPAEVTLTDAQAMTPQRKLSTYPEVQLVARISRSGNALPQAGDMESTPVTVATDSRAPIALTIDRTD